MATKFVSTSILVKIAEDALPAVRAAKLADTARAGLAGLIATGQASPSYRRYVDGIEGRLEDQVKADGTIAYRFSYTTEVILFALAYLRDRSPVGSGPGERYRDSFVITIGRTTFPATEFDPARFPEGSDIYITNLQPYGRKVDVQLVGKKVLKYSVPRGLFEDAATATRRRFGNLLDVWRIYTVDFPGRWVTRRPFSLEAKAVEYPALMIQHR